MAKIIIPTDVSQKELFKFLKDNKTALINQKKSMIKTTDPVGSYPEFFTINNTEVGGITKSVKAEIAQIPQDATSVFAKMVCNACNWCDSMMDVLLDNSSKRTIQQRKGMIPHLKNHEHKLESEIGDVQDIYLEQIGLKTLGLKESGSTQCIIMESLVQKSYDERVFNKYKSGKVMQHSIGLNYIEIYLAINSPDDEYWEPEYKIWKKYHDLVINQDVIEEYGFFWAVKEIKLLENSGVLFGSNELTPTLEIRAKNHSSEIVLDTPAGDPDNESFDLDAAILLTKFFN